MLAIISAKLATESELLGWICLSTSEVYKKQVQVLQILEVDFSYCQPYLISPPDPSLQSFHVPCFNYQLVATR